MAASLELSIRWRLCRRCSASDRSPKTDSRLRNSMASSIVDLTQSSTVKSLSMATVRSRISPSGSNTSMPSASTRPDVAMAVPGRKATASSSTTESPGSNRPAHWAGTKYNPAPTATRTVTMPARVNPSLRPNRRRRGGPGGGKSPPGGREPGSG